MAVVTIDEIKGIIATQLGAENVNSRDRIVEDLGAESSDIANIIAAVEDKYHVAVPEESIKSISTVADVFAAVQRA
jgi:acyl carrier protein